MNNIANLNIKQINLPLKNGMLETINLPLGPTCEIVSQKSKKKDFERSDLISAAMKSADIDKSNSASSKNPILITIPSSTPLSDNAHNAPEDNIGNEFIILDDASKINEELCTVKVDAESELRVPSQDSNNDEIIIIDDEDTEPIITKVVSKRKLSQNETNNELKTLKRLAIPVVPIDKLFFCESCG